MAGLILITNAGRFEARYDGEKQITVKFGERTVLGQAIDVWDYKLGKSLISDDPEQMKATVLLWLLSAYPRLVIYDLRISY